MQMSHEPAGAQEFQPLPVDTTLLSPLTQSLYEQFQAGELDLRDTAFLAALLSPSGLTDRNELTEANIVNARFNAVMQTDREHIGAANELVRYVYGRLEEDGHNHLAVRDDLATAETILECDGIPGEGGFEDSIINSVERVEAFSRSGFNLDHLLRHFLERGDQDTAIDALLHLTPPGSVPSLVMDVWNETHSDRLLPNLEAAITQLEPTKSLVEAMPDRFGRQAEVLKKDIEHNRIRHMAGNPFRLTRWLRAAGRQPLPTGRHKIRANAADIEDEAKKIDLEDLTWRLRLHSIAAEIDSRPEVQIAFEASTHFVREGLGLAYDGTTCGLKRVQRSYRLYVSDLAPLESDSTEQIAAKRAELAKYGEALGTNPHRNFWGLPHKVPKRSATRYELYDRTVEQHRILTWRDAPKLQKSV